MVLQRKLNSDIINPVTGKILVISDNSKTEAFYTKLLAEISPAKDQVVFARKIDGLEQDNFQLVIIDVERNESNALEKIRSARETYPFIPVIIIAQPNNKDQIKSFIAAGVHQVLYKGDLTSRDFKLAVSESLKQETKPSGPDETLFFPSILLEQIPLPSYVFCVNSKKILWINKQFSERYGYSDDEANKLCVEDLRTAEYRGRLQDDLNVLLESNMTNISPVEHQDKNGNRFSVELIKQRLVNCRADLALTTVREIKEELPSAMDRPGPSEVSINSSHKFDDLLYDWDLISNVLNWEIPADNKLSQHIPTGQLSIKKWIDCIHSEDRHFVINELFEVLAGNSRQSHWQLEYRLKLAEGSFAAVLDNALILRSATGQAVRIIGSIKNVKGDEPKETFKRSSFFSQGVPIHNFDFNLNNFPESICYLTGRDHIHQKANSEYLRLCGNLNVLGKPMKSVLPELEQQGIMKDLDYVYSTGKAVIVKEAVLNDRNPDGSRQEKLSLNLTCLPIRDDSGKIEGVLMMGIDTRNDLTYNPHLSQLKDNLQALIDSLGDPIWSIDHDKKLITANAEFKDRIKKMIGSEISLGDSLEMLNLDPGLLDEWRELYDRAFEGTKFTIDNVRNINDPTRFSTYTFNPIYDRENKHVIGVACFSRDITSRVAYQKAIEEQNRKLREMTWQQSHVLRAPLARILGMVELIKHDSKCRESLGDLIGALEKSAMELDQVIMQNVKNCESINI